MPDGNKAGPNLHLLILSQAERLSNVKASEFDVRPALPDLHGRDSMCVGPLLCYTVRPPYVANQLELLSNNGAGSVTGFPSCVLYATNTSEVWIKSLYYAVFSQSSAEQRQERQSFIKFRISNEINELSVFN